MIYSDFFAKNFSLVTGNSPFPWQEKLFSEFTKNAFRRTCPIPTGLGKTSVIAIWLLALVYQAREGQKNDFPRKIVYVVNRRTVVDQATREIEKIRESLTKNPELHSIKEVLQSLSLNASPEFLSISTLRGQFADNGEWREDPARPAVIIGTVDMIGSRLLFSGYGCGFKTKPLNAGFLGQDTLLVHDEAHLEPAFQELLHSIEFEQKSCGEFRHFHVMELTATSRTANKSDDSLLTDDDRKHPIVKKRIEAKKGLQFHPIMERKGTVDKVIRLAEQYFESQKAILIFLHRLEDVEKVVLNLRNKKIRTETLTGTMRGLERDRLASANPIFARFLPESQIAPQSGTVFLVCTSAGEVGVNISADHMICDLTPLDSMIQRFGRVNRFGEGEAIIDIVHVKHDGKDVAPAEEAESESEEKTDKRPPYDLACERTLSLLARLPARADARLNASPIALSSIPPADRLDAYAPHPIILQASDILFDQWSLTTVKGKMPGRPPVADWLHGVAEWVPPETHVAWRTEVSILTPDLLDYYPANEILEDYPLKPHELLRDRSDRIFAHLEKIAKREPELTVWLVDTAGQVSIVSIKEITRRDKQKKAIVNLDNCTILLPPAAGSLENGLLNGETPFKEEQASQYDVADLWLDDKGNPRRGRSWDDDKISQGMRFIRIIDTNKAQDEEGEVTDASPSRRRYWNWYVRPRFADDDGSHTSQIKQELSNHLQLAEKSAKLLADRLGLDEPEAMAVCLATRWHDLGKNRSIWQRSIGNRDYPAIILAKSGREKAPLPLNHYRHELGSLMDVHKDPDFHKLDSNVQDLVLHLIATHHGRGRPHFPEEETYDPNHEDLRCQIVVSEIPRRFGRLQRKYGRWGLAYLESLVRAADAIASRQIGDTIDSNLGDNQ
ncbi:MAG: type I-U CRISPR-associated helicase/endonuclease Cas3 [Leptonema illini]|uniref:Type I-U CRISPR-associated helicase/endonuclease Cas3 n=1 Tax=Leptonema illini TaxID=183 RepID=A0A833GYZ0_9LEPT|nr:MAG: type I-U CRISPR-associated helicase/endonuclease Cas3 [Leptonema illini]